jgi:hypothetical protein
MTPTNKHDLLCVKGASDLSSPSAVFFSSSSDLFKKVIGYDDKDFAKNGKPEQQGFVYSYKDGPEYPGACEICCFSFCVCCARSAYRSSIVCGYVVPKTRLFITDYLAYGGKPLCLSCSPLDSSFDSIVLWLNRINSTQFVLQAPFLGHSWSLDTPIGR